MAEARLRNITSDMIYPERASMENTPLRSETGAERDATIIGYANCHKRNDPRKAHVAYDARIFHVIADDRGNNRYDEYPYHLSLRSVSRFAPLEI